MRLWGDRYLTIETLDKSASREPHKYLILCRDIINDTRSERPARASCTMYEIKYFFTWAIYYKSGITQF